MRIFQMRATLFAAIAALTLTAAPAAAQQAVPETGGRVYALVGGGFGDGTFIGTGAGAGLRLTRHLGPDVELTHLSTHDDYAARMPWLGDVPVVSAVSASARYAVLVTRTCGNTVSRCAAATASSDPEPGSIPSRSTKDSRLGETATSAGLGRTRQVSGLGEGSRRRSVYRRRNRGQELRQKLNPTASI